MALPRKPMTLDEIARIANTTKSTVSRVLSNSPRISDETKARVMEIVRKHEFRPNYLARALAKGRTGVLGVLASNISSGFFADVLRGIDLAAIEHRAHLLCSFAHGNDDYARLWQELHGSGQVEGLVLIDPPLELFALPIPKSGIPFALCAARAEKAAAGWNHVDSATANNRKAMRDLVQHLRAQGCRSILHLAGPPNTFDAQERRQGFAAACRAHPDVKPEILDGHLIQADGLRAISQLLNERRTLPDAIVAFNDSTAFGVMEGLSQLAPAKAARPALTGWDDEPSAAVLGLTSVRMPVTELGQSAARLVIARLDADGKSAAPPRHEVVDGEVVLRRSSTMNPGKS